METLTNDLAREMFWNAGLSYADLTRTKLQRLRKLINEKMKASGCLKDSFRCHQRPFCQGSGERFWAGIRCRSFYFDNREAVSFNPDKFIGFAGWSDSTNIKPILEGFVSWVKEMERGTSPDQLG